MYAIIPRVILELYVLSERGDSITCGRCGRTSWNEKDVEHKYCGGCHLFLCDVMPMFVVYSNPDDCPGKYVVRRHIISGGRVMVDGTAMAIEDALAAARSKIPAGLVRLGRMPGDIPEIFEVWYETNTFL